MDQVARNKELLDVARDYLNFVTRFFEPISISAVHIYHSALELSPPSSIVRRFYYHRRHTPFPRVVNGIADSWDQSIHLSCMRSSGTYTWSPCGQFVAAFANEGVEIQDAFSSELVSTLTIAGAHPGSTLAYSPDGRLLANLSDTLTIWDIQTGGIAKEVQCNKSGDNSMVWSLDGKTIGITMDSAVHVYNVTSGTMQSIGTLQSHDRPHLWAHDESFWVMATGLDGQVFTIEIFKVGSDLTKIESFRVKSRGQISQIWSFSPTTYRIAIQVHNQLRVLDIQSSDCLLNEVNGMSNCFSFDGSLFVAHLYPNDIHIWKYTSGCYIPWKKFPVQYHLPVDRFPPQFSPKMSSILSCFGGILQVDHLDDCPMVAHPDGHTPLAVISHHGNYMVTCHKGGSTITITNLLSKNPPQLVDTNMEVEKLAITGNILLVLNSRTIAAWRLTEEGVVDSIPTARRVGHDNSIWAVSVLHYPVFTVEDQSVIIDDGEKVIHAYHTATGEVLEPTQVCFSSSKYTRRDMYYGRHYPHYCSADKQDILPEDNQLVPLVTPQVAWVKDPEGRHQLWLPVEWRTYNAGWLHNVTTLWLNHGDKVVIIKL